MIQPLLKQRRTAVEVNAGSWCH